MICRKNDINEIILYCKEKGFTTLFENGMQKVEAGIVNQKEIYKATSY